MNKTEFKNLKLILSWNGKGFSGYQYQPHVFTVQEAIQTAWKIFAKEDVQLNGCSRLDAGVHAHQFVLNFKTQSNFLPEKIVRSLNGIFHSKMNLDICVYQAEFVSLDFHARFHSVGKHYRYLVWYGFSEHAFLTNRSWHVRSAKAPKDFQQILKEYEGEHDFSAFRSADCSSQKTNKHVLKVDAWVHPLYPELVVVDIWGDGFLKNMIRNMVGTAMDVAIGKCAKNTITESFLHKNRTLVGVCAPAWPLTLMKVYYDKTILELEAKAEARHLILC